MAPRTHADPVASLSETIPSIPLGYTAGCGFFSTLTPFLDKRHRLISYQEMFQGCAPQLFDAVANQSIANLVGTGMA
jgi:hypothetical protein